MKNFSFSFHSYCLLHLNYLYFLTWSIFYVSPFGTSFLSPSFVMKNYIMKYRSGNLYEWNNISIHFQVKVNSRLICTQKCDLFWIKWDGPEKKSPEDKYGTKSEFDNWFEIEIFFLLIHTSTGPEKQ